MIIGIMVFMMMASTAFAAGSWSAYAVKDLKSSDGWKYSAKYNKKVTNNNNADFYAAIKTMTSSPKVKLCNSNKDVRSSAVAISKANKTYSTSTNTGTKEYSYQSKICPAFNQVGTDSIKYKHSSD